MPLYRSWLNILASFNVLIYSRTQIYFGKGCYWRGNISTTSFNRYIFICIEVDASILLIEKLLLSYIIIHKGVNLLVARGGTIPACSTSSF